jgi:hypothetical protein
MRFGVLAAVLAAAIAVTLGAAMAQDASYSLKDFMPRTVGSTWTMQPTGGGQQTTQEVLKAEDIGGVKVCPLATKGTDGNVRSATYETVDADNYIIYGRLFGGRQGGEPRKMLYDPPAKFSAKVKVGEAQEATFSTAGRDGQARSLTMKLEVVAVESVTVPKGTFENCLKIVTTSQFGNQPMQSTAWYAKGVGVVKTERQGPDAQTRVSELTDYKIAP